MKDKVFEKLLDMVSEQFCLTDDEIDLIDMDTPIEEISANWDSIAAVELALAIEDEFDTGKISKSDLESIHTVEDMVDFILSKIK